MTGFLSAATVTLSAATVTLSAAKGLAAQRYTETLRTSVTTRSGLDEVGRFVVRDATYQRTARADTVVMQATAVRLEETSSGTTVAFDTDGFTGGRWKLLSDTADTDWTVVSRPFVPAPLLDVSDLGAAMDDFFPATPPTVSQGRDALDDTGVSWERLSDSSGTRRYRWTVERASDSVQTVADSVPLRVITTTREAGRGIWDQRGPVAWQRRIDTASRSTLRGIAVLAIVEHQIAVRRHD